VNDTCVRFDTEAVLKIGEPDAVRRAALDAVDTWTFATEDVEQAIRATDHACAAIRESLVEALHAVVDREKMVNVVRYPRRIKRD
jgi:hypothetical protein